MWGSPVQPHLRRTVPAWVGALDGLWPEGKASSTSISPLLTANRSLSLCRSNPFYQFEITSVISLEYTLVTPLTPLMKASPRSPACFHDVLQQPLQGDLAAPSALSLSSKSSTPCYSSRPLFFKSNSAVSLAQWVIPLATRSHCYWCLSSVRKMHQPSSSEERLLCWMCSQSHMPLKPFLKDTPKKSMQTLLVYFSLIKRKSIQNLFGTSLSIASKIGLRLKCWDCAALFDVANSFG